MTDRYLHVPSPGEKGPLTAYELLFARLPCYSIYQDRCKSGLLPCTKSSLSLNDQNDKTNQKPKTKLYTDYLGTTLVPRGECSICLEELGPTAVFRQLPCGHTIHKPCADTWLCAGDASCPLCRQRLYYLRKPRILYMKEARSAGHGPSPRLVGHNLVHPVQIVKAWPRRKLSGSLMRRLGSRGGR